MSTNGAHILLIGCGKMGGAMLRSWIKDPALTQITVVDPDTLPAEFTQSNKISHCPTLSELGPGSFDAVILAVKPQIMKLVCEELKETGLQPDTVLLSIAAGKTIASFETIFGAEQPIIRTMPNTPAAIGKGVTALCPNQHVTAAQKELAVTLLSAVGSVEPIEDETLFDAITALSGSGPAYIFHLIETLASAGIKAGLPAELSEKLARQTVIGSAALAEAQPDTPAKTLRENVTSPGGTTEAALKVLMNGDLQEIYDQALAAAKQRGEELNRT